MSRLRFWTVEWRKIRKRRGENCNPARVIKYRWNLWNSAVVLPACHFIRQCSLTRCEVSGWVLSELTKLTHLQLMSILLLFYFRKTQCFYPVQVLHQSNGGKWWKHANGFINCVQSGKVHSIESMLHHSLVYLLSQPNIWSVWRSEVTLVHSLVFTEHKIVMSIP